jgi:hypothetical protein
MFFRIGAERLECRSRLFTLEVLNVSDSVRLRLCYKNFFEPNLIG